MQVRPATPQDLASIDWFVRSYALSMLGGTIAVVAVLLAVRFQ